ncbi:MAG: pyridoxal phosphate-dependent aminotransferase [Nanoarchaeota archaeon]|nr:pyridoxal phosphate-dependent aminotransferase [Nanoarchaeota archaeon]
MKDVSEREKDLPKSVIGKLLRISSERKDIISLSVGEPDFNSPSPIIQEVKNVISNYKKNRVTHYTAPQGILELREALVKKLETKNKIKVNPDEVLVTTGSQEGLFAGFASTLDPTEEVIVPNPGYLAYIPGIELLNGVAKPLRLTEEENFEINPDRLKKLITKKTRVIMLNTPSNPTGTILGKKLLEEIADIAVEKDVYIFSDEAYEDLIYDHKEHVSIGSLNGMKKYVVSFHTFSKSYAMCGFRLGYASGPKDVINAMQKTIHYITLCPPHLSQRVGLKALTMPRKHVVRMKREYDTRRRLIVRRLNEVGLRTRKPDGAFYAFSNITEYSKNSLKFSQKLMKEAKVAVVPGTEFGSGGEGFVRFSYATDYKKIKIAMDRLEKFLSRK